MNEDLTQTFARFAAALRCDDIPLRPRWLLPSARVPAAVIC